MFIEYPFSNHMVLQRNKNIVIKGQGQGNCLTITLNNNKYYSEIIDGCFEVIIHTNEVGGPYHMVFTSEEEQLMFDDVWVGDVFLAAGQSNMEWPVRQCSDEIDEVRDDVRVLFVEPYQYPFESQERTWEKYCNNYSALIASFVNELDIGIPIGVILNYKGGTSASCWIENEYLNSDLEIKTKYIDEYYQDLPSIEEQKRATIDYYHQFNTYQNNLMNFQKEHPDLSLSEIKDFIGHTPWPPPKGIYDWGRPSCLYQEMFLKTINYPIKAIIYYQGEEDSTNYRYYQKLLSLLVENWRACYQWKVPIFLIQLPEYANSHFGEIRLAQRAVSLDYDDIYLVVSLGTGDPNYIHPLSKQQLAKRLSNCVMNNLYGYQLPVSPVIDKIVVGEEVIIEFDQLLVARNVFVRVDGESIIATIKGNCLCIPVVNYQIIEYGCSDIGSVDICSLANMPVSPFRLIKTND